MEDVPRFEVLVDDNFHYMDEEERYCSGRFDRYEDALAKARQIVESEVENCYQSGKDAEWVVGRYRSFGEDPFIRPTPVDHPLFSAWKYAEEQAPAIVRKLEAMQ